MDRDTLVMRRVPFEIASAHLNLKLREVTVTLDVAGGEEQAPRSARVV